MNRRPQRGMTLIELMVSLAIGAFLMLGAITVFMQSRTTFRATEALSRLQENARFAMQTLEPDIRMAGYWGLTTNTGTIGRSAGPLDTNDFGDDTCGANWLINLAQPVEGSNNSYGFSCMPVVATAGLPEVNADTLVVRRASEDPVAVIADNRLRLLSRRGTGLVAEIFQGNAVPAWNNPLTSQAFALIVNGYYVSRGSSLGAGVPSLRRREINANANNAPVDVEIVAGVEDMQIQFGVDTDPEGNPDRGSIDLYVNSDDPMIDPASAGFDPSAEILAVRLWLRVRAERPEQGWVDTAVYQYADQNVGPFNDQFRRIVVSKTIYARNARPVS